MKRQTKIMIAVGVTIISVGTIASTVIAKGPEWRHDSDRHSASMMGGMSGPGRMGGMHGSAMMGGAGQHSQMMEQKFKALDLNNDGSVTQEEMDQTRQERYQKFDDNKDGSLDLSEFQKLWLQSSRSHMVDRFQAFDDDGDGKVTLDEFGAPMAGMITRHDRDGDGNLTMKEMYEHRRGWGHDFYRRDNDDNTDDKKN